MLNNGASYQPNLVAGGRVPAVQQQIYGTNELSSLPVDQPGHFGVDTEMIEERWLHMQVHTWNFGSVGIGFKVVI